VALGAMTVPTTSGVEYALGLTPAEYNSSGQYIGGNAAMDFYCNSVLGQTLSPSTCAISSLTQIEASQAAELATTSAPAAAQQAALAAGNQAVSSACTDDPSDCSAQAAASLYPELSAMFGPSLVASLLGINPDGSQNLFGGWGIYAVVGIAALLIWNGGR
jgi:hypothetical protein